MQMFEVAANAFGKGGAAPSAKPFQSDESKDDEIADLKAQLAALNAKIDKLS
jgi:polyhydroxyalkanoate synthesis regulator protein